jgi:hypothetical protein
MQSGLWAVDVFGACLAGITALVTTTMVWTGWRRRLDSRPALARRTRLLRHRLR